jgi:hypothetical protein
MTKHFKFAIFLFLLILPFFYYGITLHGKKVHNLSRGNYFFNKTRDDVNLNKIALSFNDKNNITFVKNNDLWRIEEADDYYADFSKINTLVELLRNTIIYRADALDNKELISFDNFIRIQTYDNNKIVDDAIISSQSDKNKYHYALLNNDNFLYQLSTKIQLSSRINDWLQMPIINLSNSDIKQVDFNELKFYRKSKNEKLMLTGTNYTKPEIYRLLNNIRNINAEEIKHASNFKRDKYTYLNSFKLTTFDGVIYKIDLYEGDKDYWINVYLDKKQLISQATYNRVKDNLMLYNGWFFKINQDKGKILSNIAI